MAPIITLEEHFVSQALQSSPFAKSQRLDIFPQTITQRLLDVDRERIAEMDAGNISLQVVSHNPGPGSLPLKLCQDANNELYEAVKKNKSRLAGFAALPMNDPPAAADELSRCISELGFVGALVGNHDSGHFYDEQFYWVIFERAQELDVPIYIHPSFAFGQREDFFKGNFAPSEAFAMSAFAWGWHSEVGLHFQRLYASGLFDKFPKLKLVIGHDGEMLPFMIDRVDRFVHWKGKQRGFRTVWDENIWVTTSGMFSMGPLECLLRTKAVDKVLFSIDYPFENTRDGVNFLDTVRKSGVVSEEGFLKIAYRNAESLLKVKVSEM